MKILRKGDEFAKMPDSTQDDLIKIHTMTERGWEFVAKEDYKSFLNSNSKQKTKDEEKKDKKVKKEKETKEIKKEKDKTKKKK